MHKNSNVFSRIKINALQSSSNLIEILQNNSQFKLSQMRDLERRVEELQHELENERANH